MGHRRPGRGADQAGHAGVAEQVQHPWLRRLTCVLTRCFEPCPSSPPARERRPGGGSWSADALNRACRPRPAARCRAQAPFSRQRPSSSSSAGSNTASAASHASVRKARRPEALRLGAHNGEAAVALQLAPSPAVQQGVVAPGAWCAASSARPPGAVPALSGGPTAERMGGRIGHRVRLASADARPSSRASTSARIPLARCARHDAAPLRRHPGRR